MISFIKKIYFCIQILGLKGNTGDNGVKGELGDRGFPGEKGN